MPTPFPGKGGGSPNQPVEWVPTKEVVDHGTVQIGLGGWSLFRGCIRNSFVGLTRPAPPPIVPCREALLP